MNRYMSFINKNRFNIGILFISAVLMVVSPAHGVETAPRISDREIIESLADLKAGQATIHQRFETIDQRFETIDQRFETIDQRFDDQNRTFNQRFNDQNRAINQRFDDQNRAINQRFDDQNKAFNQRFEGIDQRFNDQNKAFHERFTDLGTRLDFIQNLIIVLIACIAGLIGYIVWDRKTALRPVEERLIRVEAALEKDLQLAHQDGSLLTRMVNAFRELAKTDKKVAEVLRSFSLL